MTTYDAFLRSTSRKEGEIGSSGNPTQKSIDPTANNRNYQTFTSDLRGNIASDLLDHNADADGVDAPDSMSWVEMDDTRTFNKRNELRTRVVKNSSNILTGKTVILTYDKNGNLTSDGEKFDYTYNLSMTCPWPDLSLSLYQSLRELAHCTGRAHDACRPAFSANTKQYTCVRRTAFGLHINY